MPCTIIGNDDIDDESVFDEMMFENVLFCKSGALKSNWKGVLRGFLK